MLFKATRDGSMATTRGGIDNSLAMSAIKYEAKPYLLKTSADFYFPEEAEKLLVKTLCI